MGESVDIFIPPLAEEAIRFGEHLRRRAERDQLTTTCWRPTPRELVS